MKHCQNRNEIKSDVSNSSVPHQTIRINFFLCPTRNSWRVRNVMFFPSRWWLCFLSSWLPFRSRAQLTPPLTSTWTKDSRRCTERGTPFHNRDCEPLRFRGWRWRGPGLPDPATGPDHGRRRGRMGALETLTRLRKFPSLPVRLFLGTGGMRQRFSTRKRKKRKRRE